MKFSIAMSEKNEDKWKRGILMRTADFAPNKASPVRFIQLSEGRKKNLVKNLVVTVTLFSCLKAAMTSSTSAGSCSDSLGARNFFELGFRYLSPSSDLRNRLLGIKAAFRLESGNQKGWQSLLCHKPWEIQTHSPADLEKKKRDFVCSSQNLKT